MNKYMSQSESDFSKYNSAHFVNNVIPMYLKSNDLRSGDLVFMNINKAVRIISIFENGCGKVRCLIEVFNMITNESERYNIDKNEFFKDMYCTVRFK